VHNVLQQGDLHLLETALATMFSILVHTECPGVMRKLHNLFVIKDINFSFFLDNNYASTAHSENIAVQGDLRGIMSPME
jgi:hypothetical protein